MEATSALKRTQSQIKKHLITQVYSIPVLTRISFALETIFQVVTLINYSIYWRVGFISIQSSDQ